MPWTLATFNCNGIRARLAGLTAWLEANSPRILCLQEIKAQEADFPGEALAELGYHAALKGQKSFNGVAVLGRDEPDEVRIGFEDGGDESEARLISCRFGDLWVVDTYVPQGREVGAPAFEYKLEFLERLRAWFDHNFSPSDNLLWAGDMNVALTDQDVFDPKRHAGKVSCTDREREALTAILDWGFNDLYRRHQPEGPGFTFWDYRLPKSFDRDLGWRIDLILATEPMVKRNLACRVDRKPRGEAKPSDHTYLVAEFD
jgi:exodeoxyribonuclease-3